MKLFKALMCRVLAAKTDAEWNQICGDIDRAYQHDRITADENDLLYRLINRLHK